MNNFTCIYHVFIMCITAQVFHCHFNSNFFPLFLENLLGDAISPTLASTLLGETSSRGVGAGQLYVLFHWVCCQICL